jgi:hypothetical protein
LRFTQVLQPCITNTWLKFESPYSLSDGKTTYAIAVRKEASGLGTVIAARVDDKKVDLEQGTLRTCLQIPQASARQGENR